MINFDDEVAKILQEQSEPHKAELKSIMPDHGNHLVLYHGSRGGLDGDIKPISRARCDFGKGFYTGNNPQQVKGLIAEDSMPVFYELDLDLSKIQDEKILILNDYDWVCTVLANRQHAATFNTLQISKFYQDLSSKYDLIVGAIADSHMNDAIRMFASGALSDKGLFECLKRIDNGYQVVAKTDTACKAFSIISEHDLSITEIESIRQYTAQKREEGRNVVREMIRKCRGQGQYIDEIAEHDHYGKYLQNKNIDLER
jgi:hypothetical protein